MKVLTCAAACRQLEALHDEELTVSQQIAVGAHVEACEGCAAELAEIQRTRQHLRLLAPGRAALTDDATLNLQAAVVGRMGAEEAASLRASLREMFADMHLVYAGVGAAAAVCFCAVITFGMLRSATGGGPGAFVTLARGLTATVVERIWGAPGSDENPVSFGSPVTLPRSIDEKDFAASTDRAEVMLTFMAVIQTDGRVSSLDLLGEEDAMPETPGSDQARLVANLTGAASKARFVEPASREGLPVAVNMVWVVAHTTVRANAEGLTRPTSPRRRSAELWIAPDPNSEGYRPAGNATGAVATLFSASVARSVSPRGPGVAA